MPTKAQLARWRGLEIPFDSFYDTIAKDDTVKRLEIKYVSSSADKENYLVNFEIIAENLDSDKAQLFVKEMNDIFSNTLVSNKPLIIAKATKTTYELKISRKVISNLDGDYENGGFEFKGFLTCEGLSAETKEFKLSNGIGKAKSEATKDEEKCLCKQTSWTANDLKYIVTQLRKSEDKHLESQYNETTKNPKWVDENGNVYQSNPNGKAPREGLKKYKIEKTFFDSKANDGKLVEDRLFYLNRNENINEMDKSYEKLAESLNFIFKKLDAKKCINKIHILCQIYHETERFGSCYESDVSAKKSGEDFYRGRGLIMITKKSNYKAFYEEIYKKTPTDSELEAFVPKVAKELDYAKSTSSWFLNKSKIKEYFDEEESVLNVSACINRPKSLIDKKYDEMYGITERKMYFEYLKQVFNYENCK